MSELGHKAAIAAPAITASSVRGRPSDYLALMKPRVMSLVVFTALTGMLVAPGDIAPARALAALLFISLGAGASAALNMWYDADIDAVMRRTRKRPIPAGRLPARDALWFGLGLSAVAVAGLGVVANLAAAALLALTIGFYILVYTMWLKRATPQNIVIGGAAGALPPMIGWAVATGGVDAGAIALFLIIFLWTPPHFWALALFRNADYAAAGVPMLPVVAGPEETKRQILLYTLLLVPVTLAPLLFGVGGLIYVIAAALLGFAFLDRVFRLLAAEEEEAMKRAAGRLFGFSIVYLFALFTLLLAGA
ncbi:MAG TPA: protoheme IX farnesyltransferase [Thermopetrobacter sp.]|nr:protoheme IX farnesyltransferase [Thermopetrobacter sp.]